MTDIAGIAKQASPKSHTSTGLAIVLTLYLALGLAYNFTVPLWEAPDEYQHFLYIEGLAAAGRPPPPDVSYETHQPPLYYALNALPWFVLRASLPDATQVVNPLRNPRFLQPDTPQPLADFDPATLKDSDPNRYLHGPSAPPEPWGPHLLRFLSTIMGLGTLVLIYATTRCIFPISSWLPLTAVGFVAFIPQFTFISAAINSDNLANLLAAWMVYIGVGLLMDRAPTGKDFILALIVIILGIITKVSLLPVIGPLLLVYVWSLNKYFTTEEHKRHIWGPLIATLIPVSAVLAALVLAFPAQARSWGVNLVNRAFRVTPGFMEPRFVRNIIAGLNQSFWAKFGWTKVDPPRLIVYLLGGLAVLMLARALWVTVRSSQSWPQRRVLVFLWAIVLLVVAATCKNALFTGQAQGRFLYPMLAAFSTLFAVGMHWNLREKQGRALTFALLGGMFWANVACLTLVVYPAFHP
jgi:hypothetical protein